jgi:hypothetical protein
MERRKERLVTSAYSQSGSNNISRNRRGIVESDEALAIDPLTNRIMTQQPSRYLHASPPGRFVSLSPGYAVEPAAIEVMLDQPISHSASYASRKRGEGGVVPPSTIERMDTSRYAQGDLREEKTWATTSTDDTSSPAKSSTASPTGEFSKRISFRDRFMKRKSLVARRPTLGADQAKPATAKRLNRQRDSMESRRVNATETSPLARALVSDSKQVSAGRGRSPSAKRLTVTSRNLRGSTATPPPRTKAQSSSPQEERRKRENSLSRARVLVKRTLCTPKAIDVEYEASRRVVPGVSSRSTFSPQFPSPVICPSAQNSDIDSGRVETTAVVEASPVTEGMGMTDRAMSPNAMNSNSNVAKKSNLKTGHPPRNLIDEVKSPRSVRASMKERKPSSIEVVRDASHISELSLPMLPQNRRHAGPIGHPEGALGGRQGSSLGDRSVAAVRNILTQVEEELNRGVSRSDLLAQLRGLSETLEREMRNAIPEAKDGFETGEADQRDGRSRAANAIDYEKALLELRKRSLGLRQRTRSNPEDTDGSYVSEDESSFATGDEGADDDVSEFTKWLEEIENEEGGIARDSMNFLMGLFNFQSLMVVKHEEDEEEVSSHSYSEDSILPRHGAPSFKAVSTTGSNFWASLQQGPSSDLAVDALNNGGWCENSAQEGTSAPPAQFVAATSPPSDDGNDDTLSLSSIESNQYSKQSQARRSIKSKAAASSTASTTRAIASSTIVMYPHHDKGKPTKTSQEGSTSPVDYDAMWDSSRRRRSRSFRGAFRSRSRGRTQPK